MCKNKMRFRRIEFLEISKRCRNTVYSFIFNKITLKGFTLRRKMDVLSEVSI